MLERIQPVGFGEDDPIQVLLYGRSGTGKTTLWSTFPGPVLGVICSGGTNPGELRSIDTPENRDKIQTVTLKRSGELLEIMDHLRAGGLTYATLVLDHASGLQDMVLAELLNMSELPAQKAWGLASQQTYGQCVLQCKELLRSMLGLQCNVVIVAQERNFDEASGADHLIAPTVGAGLTPSLAGWLNTAVDYIMQTFIRQATVIKKVRMGKDVKDVVSPVKGQVEFCLRTAPDPVYVTKFRMPKGAAMPPVIVDPHYDKIISVVRGEPVS